VPLVLPICLVTFQLIPSPASLLAFISSFNTFVSQAGADPQLAEEYEALKLNTAAKYPTGRASYSNAKVSFIEEVLRCVLKP